MDLKPKKSLEGRVVLNPPEKIRIYHYPGGKDNLELRDVVAVTVRPSGTHRVEIANGKKFIVQPGWLWIELDVDEWTF